MPTDCRLYAPATVRNRDAILAVLKEVLRPSSQVLEIASGTGEHACYFAAKLPTILWQPTDVEPAHVASCRSWRTVMPSPGLQEAILLDVHANCWPAADAVVCINMIHITDWRACVALFTGAAQALAPGGLLFLYGPFFQADSKPAPSNVQFDARLRAENPSWGVRHLEDISKLAHASGFALADARTMPANNMSVILHKACTGRPG